MRVTRARPWAFFDGAARFAIRFRHAYVNEAISGCKQRQIAIASSHLRPRHHQFQPRWSVSMLRRPALASSLIIDSTSRVGPGLRREADPVLAVMLLFSHWRHPKQNYHLDVPLPIGWLISKCPPGSVALAEPRGPMCSLSSTSCRRGGRIKPTS